MVHIHMWTWNPKPQVSFLLLSCVFFFARQTHSQDWNFHFNNCNGGIWSYCWPLLGKIAHLSLAGCSWVRDLMLDTFLGFCWCLTMLWQKVMWLLYITFSKTSASSIKMQQVHCPFSPNSVPHTCATSNCNCSTTAFITSDAHCCYLYNENSDSRSTDALLCPRG